MREQLDQRGKWNECAIAAGEIARNLDSLARLARCNAFSVSSEALAEVARAVRELQLGAREMAGAAGSDEATQ